MGDQLLSGIFALRLLGNDDSGADNLKKRGMLLLSVAALGGILVGLHAGRLNEGSNIILFVLGLAMIELSFAILGQMGKNNKRRKSLMEESHQNIAIGTVVGLCLGQLVVSLAVWPIQEYIGALIGMFLGMAIGAVADQLEKKHRKQ